MKKYNEWGANIKNVDVEGSVHNLYVRRLLEKWVDLPVTRTAELLNKEEWVVGIYSRKLEQLKGFFSWSVKTDTIPQNPLVDVYRKREKKKGKNGSGSLLQRKKLGEFWKPSRWTNLPPSTRNTGILTITHF